jgi:hypothetical protein
LVQLPKLQRPAAESGGGNFPDVITVRHGCVNPSSRGFELRHIRGRAEVRREMKQTARWRMIMKTILSALIALSVIASVAAPASASDYNSQADRDPGLRSPL